MKLNIEKTVSEIDEVGFSSVQFDGVPVIIRRSHYEAHLCGEWQRSSLGSGPYANITREVKRHFSPYLPPRREKSMV